MAVSVLTIVPTLAAEGGIPAGCAGGATAACAHVATAEKPATYEVRGDGGAAEALTVTARPLAADAASTYLVQVFVDGARSGDPSPKPLGSFSFLPARIGQEQTFVLPKPPAGDGAAFTLSIKLVSANASRTLKDTAVEIVDARLVK